MYNPGLQLIIGSTLALQCMLPKRRRSRLRDASPEVPESQREIQLSFNPAALRRVRFAA